MNKKILLCFFLMLNSLTVLAQHYSLIEAELNDSLKTLHVQQKLEYRNLSKDTLKEIFLNDWINAFSDTRTPLARRFFEDYDRDFHYARQERRGGTYIQSITGDGALDSIPWERPLENPDLIKVTPHSPVLPGQTYTINLDYLIKIPAEDFTGYGYGNKGRYQLRYWFLTPGVYKDGWQVYSHKNMNDLFNAQLDLDINFKLPPHLSLISPFEGVKIIPHDATHKTVYLTGKDRLETEVHLTNGVIFDDLQVDSLHVLSNIGDDGINPGLKSKFVNRIILFLEDNLGSYPHKVILSTKEDYAANPMYGLNQLPKFLRPFPEGFNYDLKQLKTLTENYLQNTLLLNPRTDKWIYDGIQTYLIMKYIDQNYPDLKVLGSLSDIIGVRWFHAADLQFNDQYALLYMYMARQNLDQPLSTPQDSLVKFNKDLSNPYKAGVGLKYLDSFLEDNTIPFSLKEFYSNYRLKPSTAQDFKDILVKNAGKDISWFFKDYVETNQKIDFSIRKLRKKDDSLEVTIRNRTKNGMPVPVYGLKDEEVIYQTWVEHIYDQKTIRIPAKGIETVALNYEGIVPEINERNNYQSVTGILDKPFQLRLLKDIEDPRYTQLFIMPEVQYNLYDGLAMGAKLYNTTVLERNFEFTFAPLYGFGSETLVGGASISHQIFFDDDNLYAINYGISGSRFSYGYNLLYERYTPYLTLSFRNSFLRNSRKERIRVRNVNVSRDQNLENPLEVPDYSVFNINYAFSNPGLVEHFASSVDFQLAEMFSKASLTVEYKKLLENDRQLNFRLFGGAFLYNDMPHSDYFSFALDRPTDYLFDYNYYGRSETSGLFSQQIIMAEGGFKSMLKPEFANQWLTTVNSSATIWKWIFAYADVGVVKNKNHSAKFLYDSGIRFSIVQNYFELFLPVYSSDGWEFSGNNYDQKIRFIATLDFKTLAGLFSREWF